MELVRYVHDRLCCELVTIVSIVDSVKQKSALIMNICKFLQE